MTTRNRSRRAATPLLACVEDPGDEDDAGGEAGGEGDSEALLGVEGSGLLSRRKTDVVLVCGSGDIVAVVVAKRCAWPFVPWARDVAGPLRGTIRSDAPAGQRGGEREASLCRRARRMLLVLAWRVFFRFLERTRTRPPSQSKRRPRRVARLASTRRKGEVICGRHKHPEAYF
jgi:hypothetical protein